VRDTQTQIGWADEKFVTRNYGITHTPLFNLRKCGAIRSLSLRTEGAKYGKRLFNIASIEAYLADCERRELAATTEAVAGAARKAKKPARRRAATEAALGANP
jgi:hypothetical protein